MRDGVKLYTLILTPKQDTGPLPVILKRTPYDASGALGDRVTSRLDVKLESEFLGHDYIYVFQDIRGRFKSEGDYFMYRAPLGAFNNTDTDETTDAWDTVDWLVNNVSSNGRVGIWGNSYPGWLVLAAMRDPHPALAAAVPQTVHPDHKSEGKHRRVTHYSPAHTLPRYACLARPCVVPSGRQHWV